MSYITQLPTSISKIDGWTTGCCGGPFKVILLPLGRDEHTTSQGCWRAEVRDMRSIGAFTNNLYSIDVFIHTLCLKRVCIYMH